MPNVMSLNKNQNQIILILAAMFHSRNLNCMDLLQMYQSPMHLVKLQASITLDDLQSCLIDFNATMTIFTMPLTYTHLGSLLYT